MKYVVHMYTYIYMYIYISIYMHIYTKRFIHVYVYTYTYNTYIYIYVNAECPTRGRTWELCLFSPRALRVPCDPCKSSDRRDQSDATDMIRYGKRFHTPPNPNKNQTKINYFIRRTMVVPGYVTPVTWLSCLVFQFTARR